MLHDYGRIRTKNIARFGAVTETETEFRSVSNMNLFPQDVAALTQMVNTDYLSTLRDARWTNHDRLF